MSLSPHQTRLATFLKSLRRSQASSTFFQPNLPASALAALPVRSYAAMAEDVTPSMRNAQHNRINVLGQPLQIANTTPMTGFFRTGYCDSSPPPSSGLSGLGLPPSRHLIAAVISREFLDFTKSKGNDLETPRPELGFEGLRPSCTWCLHLSRFLESLHSHRQNPTQIPRSVVPLVKLDATHRDAIKPGSGITFGDLAEFAWNGGDRNGNGNGNGEGGANNRAGTNQDNGGAGGGAEGGGVMPQGGRARFSVGR